MLNQSEAATLGAAVADLVSSIRTIWTRSHNALGLLDAAVGSPVPPTRSQAVEPAENDHIAHDTPVEQPEATVQLSTACNTDEQYVRVCEPSDADDRDRVFAAIRRKGACGRSRSELRRDTGLGYARIVKLVHPLIESEAVFSVLAPYRGRQVWVYFARHDDGSPRMIAGDTSSVPAAEPVPIVPNWPASPPMTGATYDGNTMACEPLRPHERAALGVIHRDGPLPISTLWRSCKMPKAWQQETLYDLHRMGYVKVTHLDGPKRQTIVAATDKPVPAV
jgi:hypothetical protein